ncbi:hypothetical protein [Kitasatospora sp. NPDC004531]
MRKHVLRRTVAALLGAAAIAMAVPAATASAEQWTPAFLESGAKLMPGQSLKNYSSELVMQGDGNLVLYLNAANGAHGPILWNSHTWGSPNAYAYMQPDGNLVVYKQGSTTDALWSTGTWGQYGARLALSQGELEMRSADGSRRLWDAGAGPVYACCDVWVDHRESYLAEGQGIPPGGWLESSAVWLINQQDGNLVLYRKRDGATLWSTGTWNRPGSTAFLWGSQYAGALEMFKEGTVVWSTPVKGRSGDYIHVQDDGNFVIYDSGNRAKWSSGTWGNN